MKWFWLSFADADRFLGAVLVPAHSFVEAIKVSWILGLNPGGDVLPVEAPDGFQPRAGWAERLLSRADCEEFERLHTRGGTS